jgi:hypothetical protein
LRWRSASLPIASRIGSQYPTKPEVSSMRERVAGNWAVSPGAWGIDPIALSAARNALGRAISAKIRGQTDASSRPLIRCRCPTAISGMAATRETGLM